MKLEFIEELYIAKMFFTLSKFMKKQITYS